MRLIRTEKNLLKINVPVEAEKIYSKEVTAFGNGAKIDFVKEFIGKEVLVVVLKDGRKK